MYLVLAASYHASPSNLLSDHRARLAFPLLLSCKQASRTSSPRAPSLAMQQTQQSGRSQRVRDSSMLLHFMLLQQQQRQKQQRFVCN
jgi:hypothetical protein